MMRLAVLGAVVMWCLGCGVSGVVGTTDGGGPSSDACTGISCNAPPATTCADATTRRTYPASGVCAAGTCRYAPADVPCATGEACKEGQCAWNAATLTGLSVTPGGLSFAPSQTVYAVTVPAGTTSIAVTATVSQPSRATIRVNGVVTASGTPATAPLMGLATTLTVGVLAESGASSTYTVVVTVPGAAGVTAQQAYVKASSSGAGDSLGASVALSADGSTLAVGAPGESSNATGINGNQASNSAMDSGAVYVFARAGTTWVQEAYVKASNTEAGDYFGARVALSADGNTLAVGARGEDSNATGVNGNQADTSADSAGAVYVFGRMGTTWTQQAYVKASNTRRQLYFGGSVALNADGNTLAVGATADNSNATGINGNQVDTSAPGAGAVFVFVRTGTTWTQQAYVKASNTGASDLFGESVALSGDGNSLAVGAEQEQSNATGVNGSQSNNSVRRAGAVYVFTRAGTTWSQQAYVKAFNTAPDAGFGGSVALSADGSTLAVAARYEGSNATGIDGNQADTSAYGAGAVYVFARVGATWAQQAYVKASNTGAGDFFGSAVALSADGSALAVGAYGEESSAAGLNGNQGDNSASGAGAVYVFTRVGTAWAQRAYIKASNAEGGDGFGQSVALSADGSTLAVGAEYEGSRATGIDGNQADNSAQSAGAVYVFTR
jgi:hypothetical protein